MLDLIKYVVSHFAEKTSEIEYLTTEEDGIVTITVLLDESDMGKVIGRQGKIAKALRTIVRTASAKENKKYNVEIKSKSEV